MKHADFGKALFYVSLALVATVAVFAVFFVQQTYRELANLQQRQDHYARQLERAEEELAYRENYHRHLLENPEFVERVVRQKLGYARPGELLFRFEQRD